MAKTLYAACQKLHDCVGREDYITNEVRQQKGEKVKDHEKVIFSYTNVDKDYWQKLSFETEVGVNECREFHFMLPNNMQGNQEMIEQYVQQIADNFHDRYGVDFVVGVHDNPDNLHCHLMFNERTVINPNATQELASKVVQARWLVDDEYVTKKAYNQAMEEGGHKCEHIPKHEMVYVADKMFSNKIEHFKTREFIEEFKQDLAITMNEIEKELGTELTWQRELQDGHLAQVHVGKHAIPEVREEKEAYNEYVKEYNREYDLSLASLRDYALDKLHDMYNSLMAKLEQINVFSDIGKLFDKGEEMVRQADTLEEQQNNELKAMGQLFDKGEELIEKSEELESVIERNRELEGPHL